MKNSKRFKKLRLVALTLIGLISLQAEANLISDGSAGFFHPTTNTTLDLSGPNFPQFSNVLIDSGITVKVLSGGSGTAAQFLTQNDFLLNGIIDAGNSILNISAGNNIVLGTNFVINAGSIYLTVNSGFIDLQAGSDINITNPNANLQLKPLPIPTRADNSFINWSSFNIGHGGDISLNQQVGTDSLNQISAGYLNQLVGGTITLISRGGISNRNGNIVEINSGLPGGTLTVAQPSISVPEPMTILLMLTGLIMLTYRRKWTA